MNKVKNEDGEEVAEEGGAPIGNLPDLQSDSKVWRWAGVGFGETDVMLLQKSLKKLIQSVGSAQMRLWGKIKGTEADYYVAEGVLDAGEGDAEENPSEPVEPRGTGVNKYAYWVTNSPLGEWSMLPDLKPQDLRNARNIKFTFSGDLNRQIFTNPFYFETEKVYLRAQIARITASTTLTCKGLYRFQEEQDREIEDNTPEEGDIVKPST